MYCQHCGNQIADGSSFCSQCGKQQGGFTPPPPPMANATPSNFNTQQKSSSKEGDIKKCPSCGAVVNSFGTQCGTCGHEFRNVDANSSMEKLFMFLQQASSISEKSTIIMNFPVPNTKEAILEFLSQGVAGANADAESKSLMRKFMAFQTFGMSEVIRRKSGGQAQELASAWKTKCEQIIIKARFSMKDDKKTLEEIEYYAKQLGI